MTDEITPKQLLEAFTNREPTEPLPQEQLVERLTIILISLKGQQHDTRGYVQKRMHVVAANCLRGALIRMSQAYNDPEVNSILSELVGITADITGI